MTFKQARAMAMIVGAVTALGWYAWYGISPLPVPTSTPLKIAVPQPEVKVLPTKTGTAEASPILSMPDLGKFGGAENLIPEFHAEDGPYSTMSERLTEEPIAPLSRNGPAPSNGGVQPRRARLQSVPNRTLSTEEVVARTEGSVALVRGEKAFGTGFLVQPGILVTNAHVISLDPVRKIKVVFTSAFLGDREPAVKGLLWEDVRRDLAFLSVDSKLPPLDIEAAYKFRRGQEVTVIGNPGTGGGEILENAVSRGVMSSLMTHKNQTFFQLSVSINPGNSGGPVIGSEGRVLGVATLKNMKREGIAGCVPVGDLTDALTKLKSRSRSAAETISAIHDIRAAVSSMEEMGADYVKALETVARLMDEGSARGIDPAKTRLTAVRTYRREIGDRLHKTSVVTLYPALCQADASPHLPATARKPLHDLWKSLLEVQKSAESPRGTSAELRDTARTLKARHVLLVEQLQDALEAAAIKGD